MNLEFLYSHLNTIILILGIAIIILFIFPVILGFDLLNKDKNK